MLDTVSGMWLSYRKFKMASAAILNFTGGSNAPRVCVAVREISCCLLAAVATGCKIINMRSVVTLVAWRSLWPPCVIGLSLIHI